MRILLLLFIMAVSCNNSNSWSANTLPEEVKQPEHGNFSQRGNFIKFNQHRVVDRQATGLRAVTYLIPDGWTVQDSLYWLYNDPNIPVRYAAKCESPDRTQKVDIYPDTRAVWNTGNTGTSGLRPPADIIAGLKWVLQTFRPGVRLNIKQQIVLPATAQPPVQQNGMNSQAKSQRGMTRVEYEKNGQLYEEEIYGLFETNTLISRGVVNSQTIGWSLGELMGFSAPKGKLESTKKIALTIKSSSRMTLPFFNRLVQVIQLLQDQYYQQVYAAGQISRIISQTSDQINRTISDSYWNTQKANDRTNQQFSDYVRGVERYTDNRGTEFQLPSGYGNAWTNSNGEYIVTDEVGIDPGRQYGGTWQQLQRR